MRLLPPPGAQRTRQLALLALLLVVMVVVGFKYYGQELGGTTTAPPATGPVSQAKAGPATPAASSRTLPQPVQLERLEPVPEPTDTARNPFRFYVPPPPPPPPRVNVAPPPPPAPAPPPGPPPIPPIPLNFIGRVEGTDGKIIASLSDGKGTIFVATAGQIVDGRYRVVSIGQESLMIEYVNGTGRRTLPLR
jgi:hypothetical protein